MFVGRRRFRAGRVNGRSLFPSLRTNFCRTMRGLFLGAHGRIKQPREQPLSRRADDSCRSCRGHLRELRQESSARARVAGTESAVFRRSSPSLFDKEENGGRAKALVNF